MLLTEREKKALVSNAHVKQTGAQMSEASLVQEEGPWGVGGSHLPCHVF